jgi:phosphoglycerate dehydrogenase-like enzyme
MTETALLHMLTLARRGKQLVRNQDARRWEVLPPTVLSRKRVTIVGLGTAGATMARVFAALGMRVVAVSRTERHVEGVERILPRERLADAVADADFVVLALPGGDETAGLVDTTVLAAMKPTAFLVNVSRGSVVDEDALVAALQDGGIAGAGLDVFAAEPLPPESPLWELDNAVVTPHLAGRSDRYVEQALGIVEPNLRAFLAGRRGDIVNVVDRRDR